MLRAHAMLFCAALCLASPSARSQEIPPPDVTARDITSGGKLVGCALDFTVAFRDQIYRQGGFAAVTGSINLLAVPQNRLVASLKVVGFDIRGATPERFKVATGTLFDLQMAPYPLAKSTCEIPEAFCGVLRADAFLGAAESLLRKGAVTIAFNRAEGSFDVPVSISAPPIVASKMLDCGEKLATSR